MNKIDPINLSPSFLSKVISKGYDYATAEKLGLIKKETKSMSDGKVMHSFLSAAFGGKQEDIAISPYENYRTKEARNWRDSQPDNTLIISQAQADLFAELTERVKNHPEVKKILDGASIEPEKIVERKLNDWNVKGILDIVAKKDGATIVIDWKYVNSKTFDDFGRKALWENYDLQASTYDFLLNATHVYFVAIESEAPHRIKVWYCSQEMLEDGAGKFDKALQIIKEAQWRKPTFDIVGVEDIKGWGY